MCAIQKVNGRDKILRGLWMGYDSRCQAHRSECVKNCNAAVLFTLNSFPCVSRMVRHPKDIQPSWHNCDQPWQHDGWVQHSTRHQTVPRETSSQRIDTTALESTWDSIPMEHFRHPLEFMPLTNWGFSDGKRESNSILGRCSYCLVHSVYSTLSDLQM